MMTKEKVKKKLLEALECPICGSELVKRQRSKNFKTRLLYCQRCDYLLNLDEVMRKEGGI
jgi:uncharacterized protein YbaR (Trm112 family)